MTQPYPTDARRQHNSLPAGWKTPSGAAIVSDHMCEILRLFKPGAKIAIVVRSPGFPERDFIMTNDTLPELIGCLERRARARGEPHPAVSPPARQDGGER